MNQIYTTTKIIVEKAPILVIGLQPPEAEAVATAGASMRPFSVWRQINTAEEARQWLSVTGRQLPLMIFADHDAISAGHYSWVQHFRQQRNACLVPVIAFNCPENMDRSAALKTGIDDWMVGIPAWSYLLERGGQLRRIRSLMLSGPAEVPPLREAWRWHRFKRLVDVLVAATGLIVLSPLLLLIAAAIRLESAGPVIYRSRRAGRHYRVFDFLKFRSMYADADRRLSELQHLNQYSQDHKPIFVKFKDDPRITRVGRFIRKTSLDELPQLVNVLRGEMSLIGNRPLPLYEAAPLCRDETAERFLAPAGITGLWQVTKRGRDEMSAAERIQLDIEYARKYGFWYDLRIVLMTLPAMLQHENV